MLALFLVLLQRVSDRVFRASAVALFTAPLATGLVGLALLLGLAPGAEPLRGGNAWLISHITLSVLGLALLALAFIAAALYLLQFRELKAKRFGPVFLSFPPLERLGSLNRSALGAGLPALPPPEVWGPGGGGFSWGPGGGGGGDEHHCRRRQPSDGPTRSARAVRARPP